MPSFPPLRRWQHSDASLPFAEKAKKRGSKVFCTHHLSWERCTGQPKTHNDAGDGTFPRESQVKRIVTKSCHVSLCSRVWEPKPSPSGEKGIYKRAACDDLSSPKKGWVERASIFVSVCALSGARRGEGSAPQEKLRNQASAGVFGDGFSTHTHTECARTEHKQCTVGQGDGQIAKAQSVYSYVTPSELKGRNAV